MENKIIGIDHTLTKNYRSHMENGSIIYEYDCAAKAVFGMGERYCSINHIGRKFINRVFEKFCEQNENAYLPMPFYHASDGHGVFVNTAYEVLFDFTKGHFKIEIKDDAEYEIIFFYGSPKEIISQFVKKTGQTVLPPKWAFGVWASANRWNCQAEVEEQLRLIKTYQYPVNVMVLEAWSDEATFYAWNGSKYDSTDGNDALCLQNITFKEPWPNPKAMIETLHKEDIKLILWQIPALKLLDEGQVSKQHEIDCQYAIEQNLVAKKEDDSPYRITKQWFIGSMIPDFANPKTKEWWFKKRQYLLDMGVDGFKTDGGEFVHDLNTKFYNDSKGEKVRNLYPEQYEQAYTEFIGEDRVLFSRAGYVGAQTTPIHWAGDQLSDFNELKSVLNAGISLSLSGVPFWSFDIGGFAGPLPSKELYLRATALAAFVPAMQWHSEPADGQFEDILKGNGKINDRSPWNIANAESDESIIKTSVYFANIHMNILPYLYHEAWKCVRKGTPLMKHLLIEYPQDQVALSVDDEFMIGDLLIAPIVKSLVTEREVYLPAGNWYDLWTGIKSAGSTVVKAEAPLYRIPLYLREGAALLLNLGEDMRLGSFVGNTVSTYQNLLLLLAGEKVNYSFADERNNRIEIVDGKVELHNLAVTCVTVEEFTKVC